MATWEGIEQIEEGLRLERLWAVEECLDGLRSFGRFSVVFKTFGKL
jgi:hypothetical protein